MGFMSIETGLIDIDATYKTVTLLKQGHSRRSPMQYCQHAKMTLNTSVQSDAISKLTIATVEISGGEKYALAIKFYAPIYSSVSTTFRCPEVLNVILRVPYNLSRVW